MTKCIVETTGNFGLQNLDRDFISQNGPSVTQFNVFIEEKVAVGALKLFAVGLPDKASNDEFQKYVEDSKGNIRLAISAFCSQFGIDPAGDRLDQPEGTEGTAPLTDGGKSKADEEEKAKAELAAKEAAEKEAAEKAAKEQAEKEEAEKLAAKEAEEKAAAELAEKEAAEKAAAEEEARLKAEEEAKAAANAKQQTGKGK